MVDAKGEAIQNAIGRLNGSEQWFGRKEIAELPKILQGDELPERIIQGFYAKGNGILVATNKRLVFVDKGLLWGLRVEDFPYAKITSIEYTTGMVFGELTIYTAGNHAKIEQVFKGQVREFAEYVRTRISGIMSKPGTPESASTLAAVSSQPPDLMAQIERLTQLKAQGALTDDEFTAAKAKLLGL